MTDLEENLFFPYRDVDDDEIVENANERAINRQPYEHYNFENFNHTDHKTHEIDYDLDPENNFYNNINNNCQYYTDDQFKKARMEGISIVHFNSRSLNKNFGKIKKYLAKFNKFSVIAVSETWLNDDKNVNVDLEGYELFTSNRTNKSGGGVALYVDSTLRCSRVQNMTYNIDNILECLTVELIFDKSKNMVISCIYRTPGTCLETFSNAVDNMFGSLNNNKVHIACGDFNIDLLNPYKKKQITDFIDTMFSNSLIPVITKPTRITTDTATLIDNIFINSIDTQVTAGLLLNDTSDHLPVFAVFHHHHKMENTNSNIYRLTRHRTPETVAALRVDLSGQSWNEVYDSNDPNKSYDAFVSKLVELYNKHCPIRKNKINIKNKLQTPWITKGIENACKKKNILYRTFIKQRTKDAENKYKAYKNKLTNIIRTSKKDYYHKQLEQQKGNIQAIWKTLNHIIRKGTGKGEYPNYFIKDNITIENNKIIVNELNHFFVNVGPTLANEIPEPGDKEGLDYRIQILFLLKA